MVGRMVGKFSRHEQVLRIFTLLEVLNSAKQPLSDDVLINALRDRLGLSNLSSRTLRRDCEFLISCGYPLDRAPIHSSRRTGWKLDNKNIPSRKIFAEPLTLLELVASEISRELLKPFIGTVLWTGIESLSNRLMRTLPESLRSQLARQREAIYVHHVEPPRHSERPRLISTLHAAIVDCRVINLKLKTAGSQPLRPQVLVLTGGSILLVGLHDNADSNGDDKPVVIPLEQIETVNLLDRTFLPDEVKVPRSALVAAAVNGRPGVSGYPARGDGIART